MPAPFHAGNGISLGGDASLLSEIRAPGGFLTACALLILAGAFRLDLMMPSLHLIVLVCGSFGPSRLLGMGLDGMPSSGIVVATLVELVVAFGGLMILTRERSAKVMEPTSKLSPAPTTN